MKKIASVLLGVILIYSCHFGDTARQEDIKVIADTAKVEAGRRAVTAPLPSPDSYIPAIPKNTVEACDTLKLKGGQNMVIGYSISPKKLEKLDDKTKLYVAETTNDFGAYYYELIKNLPTGTESLNTSACYINLGDTILGTDKDKFGIILLRADGARKIIPGMRTSDEWKASLHNFFDKYNY